MSAVLILSSCPDKKTAEKIAESLISQKLAACVHVGAPMQAFYEWEGKFERSEEIPLQIKALSQKTDQIIQKIKELHPFQVPEILAIPVQAGFEPYLQWIEAQTR